MNRKSMALTALGLAAVVFVGVNVASQRGLRDVRLDLTQDRLYTLSPATRHILANLKSPITLKYFFSEKLSKDVPAIKTYSQRVRELLQEYADRSNGKITLQVIDPEPFSEAEDQATAAGINAVPLDNDTGRQFYFGLSGANSIDKQVAIGFFQPDREAFLEYDLTKLVYELGNPDKPEVSIITDMPLEFGPGGPAAAMRGQGGPYAVLSQLQSFFDVKVVSPTTVKIDDKTRVLIVARPKHLSDATLYAIDQYVLKGGAAMFFVDPYAESDVDPRMGAGTPSESSATLPKLFDAWGIEMAGDQFVADPRLAISINAGGTVRKRLTPYPAWLELGPDNLDPRDVVTANLNAKINIATAGALKVKPGAEVTLTPLLFSSPMGQLIADDKVGPRPDPDKLVGELKDKGETEVLAARVGGTLKSAFAEPPKVGDQTPDPASQVKQSAKPANVIVVADSDMLEDRFWAQTQQMAGQSVVVPFAGNGEFVFRAVQSLTGSVELNTLRGAVTSSRPFTVVENLRRTAEQKVEQREHELTTQLRDTERQLSELQGKAAQGSTTLLSPEQKQAIQNFRDQLVRIRAELRGVQHGLDQEISRVANTVKFINIAVVPLLVAFAALALAAVRVRGRRRRTRD